MAEASWPGAAMMVVGQEMEGRGVTLMAVEKVLVAENAVARTEGAQAAACWETVAADLVFRTGPKEC